MSRVAETRAAVETAMNQFFEGQKKEKVERFKRLNPMAKKGQIVFAGSSLMEQFPINEMIQNYDVQLPYAIYNRGIGGYTTQEMLQELDVMVHDLQPKYVFINIGTNDLSAPDYDEAELIARYREILDEIEAHTPGVQIYMLAYYPMCTKKAMKVPYMKPVLQYRNNERVASANLAVKQLAKESGHVFLDLNAGLLDEDGDVKEEYSIEGMHMYANGYEQVLNALLPTLKELS